MAYQTVIPVLKIPGYDIKFVFRRTPPSTRRALIEFWEKHRDDWTACTRPPQLRNQFTVENNPGSRSMAILSNAACVAFTDTNEIAGVAWIKIARMPVDSEAPELIYFQRMYVAQEHRSVRLTRKMINAFHRNLVHSSERSPLVKYLLAENANKKLKTPIGRRHFIRQGFQYVGVNSYKNEIWKMPLPPPPIRPILSIFRCLEE